MKKTGEIELANESIIFVKPNFLLEEVTDQKKHYNSMLLMNPFCEWGKKTQHIPNYLSSICVL